MKPITVMTKAARTMFAGAICISLFSFIARFGGEGYEIFLGDKLIAQQFGKDVNSVKSLSLNVASYQEDLTVKYYHCGKQGTSRTVTIKDEQNRILKQWHFADGNASALVCPLKEVGGIQSLKGNANLYVYYSSRELPNGRMLVTLTRS